MTATFVPGPSARFLDTLQGTKLTKQFDFMDQGRTFSCSVEAPTHVGMGPWWFFKLDSESNTRYAPFEASAGDTLESVKTRVIAYYAELLATRARPAHARPAWVKREPVAGQG